MSTDTTYFADMEAKIPHGKVRTRFAPSPTGYMHVGNLRTALYTWLIARNQGGTFILRIEDTDQGRLVEGAVDVIYRTMTECGLDHDEGPDVGGPVAPYIQSERRDTYGKYAHLLVEKGCAYYCFCEKAESQEDSGEFDRGDDPCRSLSAEEVQAKLDAGVPYVIRQKMPREGSTTFHDAIFGDITVENSELEDQILLKSDGLPTYNFANVIDDHLMGITHVVRGNEYLSSAPKYDLLYRSFGWDVPTYVHCCPVMRDQHNKMSKRHGDPSYEDLKAQGFLTEAILNYVALLGWSPRGEQAEQEIFSLKELAEAFDISGISKSPAIFDIEKLTHFNALYLRAMTPEAFHAAAEPYIRQAVKNPALDTREIAALLQARCERLTEIPEKIDFFETLPEYGKDLFTNKKSKTNDEVSKAMLEAAIPALEALPAWDQDSIHDCLIGLAEKLAVKNATLMWPVRIAAAGRAVTPGGAVEICRILGREETLRRLRLGLEKAVSWLKEQTGFLREFLRTDFRRILLFCAIGMLLSAVLGAGIALAVPDLVDSVLENFMEQVQEAGVIDESGNMSVFALLLNNWRAMLVSALYGFIPFLFLPILSLFVNGALLGMLAMYYHANRISLLIYFAGIIPHGIFELPAMVIAIACGVYLCRNMCRLVVSSPKREPMIELCSNLLRVLLLIVMPLVAAAAVIECYVTPWVMGLFMYLFGA